MNHLTFSEIQQKLNEKALTVTQLLESYLKVVEERNRELNIFLEVFKDSAKAKAVEVDQKIQAGTAGKLAGMILAVKDNLCIEGYKVTASSKILEGFVSPYTATAVERLLKEDAIIIGRTNCDEFAMGSSNENSAFGNVKNPADTERVPGGSSGGSAAAVSAGMCTASLGSDTGGSIRQPAALCGTVGLKPTYGSISRFGLIAYASSFDQIGPFTRNVSDAALLLQIMGGKDEHDSTSSSKPMEVFPMPKVGGKKKIAVIKETIESDGLDPEIKEATQKLIAKLEADGHQVNYVDFPLLKFLVPIYYILTTAEASSNLSRYDGIHFGYRSPNAKGIEDTYYQSRSEGFGTEVKRRILLGTFVLSSGYYDAYYSKAQKARKMVKDATLNILADNDFILTPSTASKAFKMGEKSNDPIQMYLEDIYTVQANLTGIPAISLPCNTNSLPFGVQLMAKPFHDDQLLAFSSQLTDENRVAI